MAIDRCNQGRSVKLRLLLLPLLVALVLSIPSAPVTADATFIFPVQSEQVITGATTGLSGAQADDGIRENLREADVASDSVTLPSSQTVDVGSIVGGTFPADIAADDGTPIQFRERTSPKVKSVQNGQASLGLAATSVTAALSPGVNLSAAFLVFGIQCDCNTTGAGQVSGQITSPTTVTFRREAPGAVVTIEWYVAEFLWGVSVQRGSRTMTSLTENVVLSNVTLSRSFVIVSYRVEGVTWGADDFVKARLSSETNLELTINAVPGANAIEYQVVEFAGARVQTGEVSLLSTEVSTTATLSPSIDPGRSWLLLSYKSDGGTSSDIGQKMVRGVITDSSTLTFDRANSGQAVQLTWFLVEFTAGTTVERGLASFSTVETQRDVTVGGISPTIVAAAGLWNRGGTTPFNGDDNPGVATVTMDFTTASNLRLTRATAQATTATVSWFAVSFPAEAAIAYRSNTSANGVNSPKTRMWDGTAWGGEAEQSTAGSPIRVVRMAWSPTAANTRMVVTQSDDGWLDAYVCTPACSVTNDIGRVWTAAPGAPQKRFDVAYEGTSGEALLVYAVVSTNPAQDIAYRAYVAGAWSGEQYLDDAGHATDVQYASINLAAQKGTDRMGLIGGDITNDDVNAWIWDGDAFGSYTEITANSEIPNQEKIAVAWESGSGHLLAVTIPSGSFNIVYREFSTSWSAASTFRCADDNAEYISLKPNPEAAADDMVLALSDDVGGALNLHTCYWTGSGWSNWTTHDTGIDSTVTRSFDFAWEASGNRGLLVWGTTAGQISYRTFTAPDSWGMITSVPMGANTHPWVQLRTSPLAQSGGTRILGAIAEASSLDLGGIRWDGTTFAVIGPSTFSADIGSTAHESFELEYAPDDDHQLRVRYQWTGVPTGDAYVLSVKGYRGDEDMNVQVLTPPSTWNTRMVVNSPISTMLSYTLAPAEYSGGNPQLRIVDGAYQDQSSSDLFLDWVAITTVVAVYSLEVRHNVTGIAVTGNPALIIRGNISASGENFDVQVWNFATVSWDTLLAAPFTSADAYHNATLSSGYLSAGTVRVRFVDVASQDAVQWAMSLDFVAVAVTNASPTLTNSGVSPPAGNVTTTFTFFVRYTDADDDPPLFVNLTLDGVSYPMLANNTADLNHVDGKDYHLNRTVGNRGTFSFSFSARAASGDPVLVSTGSQQISVSNRGPAIASSVSTLSLYRRSLLLYVFNASDPDLDPLSWSVRTNASFLAMGTTNGTLYGRTSDVPAIYWVEVTVSDGVGGTDTLTFSLAVVNRPPQILLTAPESARSNDNYTGSFSAMDPDSDTVSWSIVTNASWLAISPLNGTLRGVALPGVYYVNLTARDPYGGLAFRNFTIRVSAIVSLPDGPGGLGTEPLLFSIIAALVGFLFGAVYFRRRRQILEHAFLVDSSGQIRFQYAAVGTRFDESTLRSYLRGRPWQTMDFIEAPPHKLHFVHREGLHWILVSRSSDPSRVLRSAEGIFAQAERDLGAPESEGLSVAPKAEDSRAD